MITAPVSTTPTRTTLYQRSVAHYWDSEHNAVNVALGEIDGLHHHHYGIGEADLTVLDAPEAVREARINTELHRLEQAQADLLADHLGPVTADDWLFDAGCGHGAGSLVAHSRFGCHVDGVTLSPVQQQAATHYAERLGAGEQVTFHTADMLSTGLRTGAYTASWNNESDMYVDLDDLFAEHARLLKRGGRYVAITGVINDLHGMASRSVSRINWHYECDVHKRGAFFKALARHRLAVTTVIDLTHAALPYWRLRERSSHLATGIEADFLAAYQEGSFQYMLIAADRI
ncbi:geranyl diphosphate 2-C-methyltransferase [Streptomyces chartreusis]|uniref:geranyl diphosphate 2-C-methyltransferase n=1 Tax=Streptomyces chartreusis TaxID=1969 RepID=UPI002E16FA02|nr:geranyl diphosphate 2-C-methyltransferase [Streptomyces chartreusis]